MDKLIPRGLFITGTDTGVGKTHISAILAHQLNRRGLVVRPRKPVESGCIRDGSLLIPADATVLKAAAQCNEPLSIVCPYRFESALSPEKSAALAKQSLTLDQIHSACLQGVENDDFLLVEGAGGFYSPMASGKLNADLAAALNLAILLVTADRLGAINQVLMAAEVIKRRNLPLVGVVLNRVAPDIDPQMDNITELGRWLGDAVMSTTYSPSNETAPFWEKPQDGLSNLLDRLTAPL